jgi:hypothetical protein
MRATIVILLFLIVIAVGYLLVPSGTSDNSNLINQGENKTMNGNETNELKNNDSIITTASNEKDNESNSKRNNDGKEKSNVNITEITDKNDDPKRPYKRFVEEALEEPVETRADKYFEVAKQLKRGMKYRLYDKNNLNIFVKEIVLQRDYAGLEKLELLLENHYAKKILWISLSWRVRRVEDEEGRNLLKKWAMKNTSSPVLLCHHPNGIELMMRMIEDRNIEGDKRAQCALFLENMENTDLLPRLKKYINDKTVVFITSSRSGKPTTLGDIIKNTVRKLEALENKK